MDLSPPKINGRLIGMCRSCFVNLYGDSGAVQYETDFAGMRDVICYRCGAVEVDQAGNCLTRCKRGHNATWLQRLFRWLDSI